MYSLLCSRWMDLHPGICFSNLDPQVCECVRVCGLDRGYVSVWVRNGSVCWGVFESCSGRKRNKWVREEVMKGESRGRWDTLMMLIFGLSHRWYEWFLFGWSSSRTPGVLLSFLLLFIYLFIYLFYHRTPHLHPTSTRAALQHFCFDYLVNISLHWKFSFLCV